MQVGIVGLGHIGAAIGRGLAPSRDRLAVLGCDRNADKRAAFTRTTGFRADSTSDAVVASCSVILLCVRADQVEPWLVEHGAALNPMQTLICLSAGVSAAQLAAPLGSAPARIVRAITNVNVATRAGFTLLLDAPAPHASMPPGIEELFHDLGEVLLIRDEAALDDLSLLTGCAPAATAIFLRGMMAVGERLGFDPSTARQISLQCLKATVDTIQQQDVPPRVFERTVASPGGVVDRLLDAPETANLETATTAWFEVLIRQFGVAASLTRRRPRAT